MMPHDCEEADVHDPLFDERLHLVNITQWTPIPISKQLAINLISQYLENDYTIFPLFNADLFVRDLVDERHCFCSPFLVNSILSWAFQTYRPFNTETVEVSRKFFAQAQEDFSCLTQHNTLSVVAALQISAMSSIMYGEDDLGLQLLQDSVGLGSLMGLFNISSQAESANIWLNDSEDWVRSASYTAWGVYNWVS
ncbi:hypothetical protein Ct61P_01807 [Colletotrichum tofieldiae]|nr:hypothetical protein Ct61P_01807 [Colletotrichum tofieldiae]